MWIFYMYLCTKHIKRLIEIMTSSNRIWPIIGIERIQFVSFVFEFWMNIRVAGTHCTYTSWNFTISTFLAYFQYIGHKKKLVNLGFISILWVWARPSRWAWKSGNSWFFDASHDSWILCMLCFSNHQYHVILDIRLFYSRKL